MKRRVFLLFALLLAFVPLGLLTEAPAWGEWGKEFYQKNLGFIPEGIARAKELSTLFADYTLPGVHSVLGYYISAIVGSLVIMSIFYLLAKINNGNS